MNLFESFCRYFQTLRHLKLSFFFYTIWYYFYNPKLNKKIKTYSRIRTKKFTSWIKKKSAITPNGAIKIFNVELAIDEDLWRNKDIDLLIQFNVNYFDFILSEENSKDFYYENFLIHSWIRGNDPSISIPWHSYPLSMRLVNWIKFQLLSNQLDEEINTSIALQAQWLSKRLENNLGGNHLLANSKALIFAGAYFGGAISKYWLRLGLKILKSCLEEQILDDGGHFELSPMYHSIILEDLLDIKNILYIYSLESEISSIPIDQIIVRMFTWLKSMTHINGEISFFNDAALNIASNLFQLERYASSIYGFQYPPYEKNYIESPIKFLESSGYVRIDKDKISMIADIGKVGPDFLPAHAHADTLSFEMSILDERVIVNGGTSRYGYDADRLRERQTISHSTVEVNGQSSSEVWGGFRVARRARPFDLRIALTEDDICVGCSHDGYMRLKGEPIHRREWFVTKKSLIVSDWVAGGEYKSIARFILHPSVSIERLNVNHWCIYTPHGQKVLFQILSGYGFVEPANYAPEFGVVLQTQCLAIELTSGQSRARLQWN